MKLATHTHHHVAPKHEAPSAHGPPGGAHGADTGFATVLQATDAETSATGAVPPSKVAPTVPADPSASATTPASQSPKLPDALVAALLASAQNVQQPPEVPALAVPTASPGAASDLPTLPDAKNLASGGPVPLQPPTAQQIGLVAALTATGTARSTPQPTDAQADTNPPKDLAEEAPTRSSAPATDPDAAPSTKSPAAEGAPSATDVPRREAAEPKPAPASPLLRATPAAPAAPAAPVPVAPTVAKGDTAQADLATGATPARVADKTAGGVATLSPTPGQAPSVATLDPSSVVTASAPAKASVSVETGATTTAAVEVASDDARARLQDAAEASVNRMTLRQGAHGALDVPELGRVEVSAQLQSGEVQVNVRAERPETAHVLAAHAAEIIADARSADVTVGRLTFDQGRGAAGTGGGTGNTGAGGQRPTTNLGDARIPKGGASVPTGGSGAPSSVSTGRVRFVL